ncbi:MAG: hypothetical protein GY822_21145 [Deltaproteobacteria bacterium]|nr:hypothetical protein [Deltaproteobacteria bacterium]
MNTAVNKDKTKVEAVHSAAKSENRMQPNYDGLFAPDTLPLSVFQNAPWAACLPFWLDRRRRFAFVVKRRENADLKSTLNVPFGFAL